MSYWFAARIVVLTGQRPTSSAGFSALVLFTCVLDLAFSMAISWRPFSVTSMANPAF